MDTAEVSKSNSQEDARTIYVGNIPPDATEELVCAIFSQFGEIKSCKMLAENGSRNTYYAFVEYKEHQSAAMAVSTFGGRVFLGRTIKVNWANSFSALSGNGGDRVMYDKSKQYSIFVGDLSHEVNETELRTAFSRFGVISECRIMRDPETLKSRNYGFITFTLKEAARQAITYMNGFWIGNRSIRTNWAHKRGNNVHSFPNDNQCKPSYNEVDNLTSPMNSTIFCGNIKSGLSEDFLRSVFSPFGHISRIRVFPDKGYGFVNFMEKASAVNAILEMNQTLVKNDIIRVSWGKEQSSAGPIQVQGGPYPAVNYLQYLHYQQTCAMFMQHQGFHQTILPLTSVYLGNPQSQMPAPLTVSSGGVSDLEDAPPSQKDSKVAHGTHKN